MIDAVHQQMAKMISGRTIYNFPSHQQSLISPSLQLPPHFPLNPTITSFPPHSNNPFNLPLTQFTHFPLTPTIHSFSPHSNNSLVSPSLQQFPYFPLTPTIHSFPPHSNNSLIFPSLQQFSLRFTHQIEATTKIVETRPLVINCSCCLVSF